MTDNKHKQDIKRIQVTFTKTQWKVISSLKGYLGQTDAEVVRNIVLNWLSEKSLIASRVKSERGKKDE